MSPSAPAIGRLSTLGVDAESHGRGIESVAVEIEQDGALFAVGEETFEAPPVWRLWQVGVARVEGLEFEIGAAVSEGLKEGDE